MRNFITPYPLSSTVNLHSFCRSDLVNVYETSTQKMSHSLIMQGEEANGLKRDGEQRSGRLPRLLK
jgi:hypothetical protein